jgi:DNA-binding transcriptional regulator YiaG
MGWKMAKKYQKMTRHELKAARGKLGMTMADLAKRLRTEYTTYVKWERGERPISGACHTAVELLLWQDAVVMRAIEEQVAGTVGGRGLLTVVSRTT